MATSVPGHHPCHLFYVPDRTSDLCFLVDTRTKISIISPSASDHKHHKNNLNLQAVINTSIATYGNILLTLNIELCRAFQWVFIIADVKNPIIGSDFLSHYSILVDIAHDCLVDIV